MARRKDLQKFLLHCCDRHRALTKMYTVIIMRPQWWSSEILLIAMVLKFFSLPVNFFIAADFFHCSGMCVLGHNSDTAKCYSVPHEESRKMFLFIVHFTSFLQNQLSYGHVLCTTMIPYLP